MILNDFGRLHFGRAPAGDPDADLEMLTAESTPCGVPVRRGRHNGSHAARHRKTRGRGLDSFEESARASGYFLGVGML
jgi:hypothetical protein